MNYRLLIHTHRWQGNRLYRFHSLADLLGFVQTFFPASLAARDIARITLENDKYTNRCLFCGLQFSIEKGEPQMTEYTSY